MIRYKRLYLPELIFSVRAGLVSSPEDYVYSSARDYPEMGALLDVDKISMKWKTVQ
jgi:hypothetical protein